MMVKNEEPVICETLKSYVEGGIDAYFIFDTGSIDNTTDVTKKYLQERGVQNAVFVQEPFIDFSTSRNRALELAEKQFPKAHFFLMPDAEWRIENPQKLLAFCELHKNDPEQAYQLRMVRDNVYDYYTSRLMKKGARFVGAVHEVVNAHARVKVSSDVHFYWHRSHYGLEKSRERWLRDIKLLLKSFDQNPHDPRTAFYIAQTYACLENWHKARDWYSRRISMEGWDEENFVARQRLADVYERLSDWHSALAMYLDTYAFRPTRAEPLVCLAQHYWDSGEYDLCYLFARRASEIQYPKNDILFIEKELYDFTRHDLLGRVAWYVADYERGEQATQQAINARPKKEYLHENLRYYIERKRIKKDNS
jgi:tetratricopeptide (TPR) repeat protein